MNGLFLLAACLASTTSAFWWGGHDPAWNGMQLTFGLNPFNSHYFADMPRTEDDAKSEGWVKIEGECTDSGIYGVRYMKDNDPSAIMVYGVQGKIAGFQTGINKKEATTYPPQHQIGQMFHDDGHRYVLTAYFVDPATVCTTGRDTDQFAHEGTGTGLYIKNGTGVIHIPSEQKNLANTAWTEGKCFPWMGKHYWYSTSKNMDCDNFQPVFLLYDEGKLNAFGWAMGIDQSSDHYEHPPANVIDKFFQEGNTPDCLKAYAVRTTMHIYLTQHPKWTNICI